MDSILGSSSPQNIPDSWRRIHFDLAPASPEKIFYGCEIFLANAHVLAEFLSIVMASKRSKPLVV